MRCLALVFVAALLLSGCGAAGGTSVGDDDATLLLDFQPNGVHAGIYLAKARAYDQAEGIDLEIRRPGASTDALKLLRAGRVQAALLDIHDLGLAAEKGADDLVGVMAVVQEPLAAVIAQPGISSPKALEGKRAGVTGLPSDDAVLDSEVRAAGGDPKAVRRVTIGFEAVKALLAGRVDAATAFWNVEGVELERRRPGFKVFKVGDYGAPRYPELVLVVRRSELEDDPALVTGLIRTLQRGYLETEADPESAVQAMTSETEGLDAGALTAQLDAVQPAFSAGAPVYGALNPAALRAWAAWDVQFGILRRRPDVARLFDTTLVKAMSRD